MILSGKTILITRASSQASEFVRMIEFNGGKAIEFPTIKIVPPESWDECDQAIKGLYMYDGLIFTSVNSVEFFFQRLNEKMISTRELEKKSIFVVGEKTKLSIEQRGLAVTAMPEKFTAQDLATKIQQEDMKGKYFLFPKGNLSKDMLPATLKFLGADIDEVIIYQTTQPKIDNLREIEDLISGRKIDVVTFTSPSTVKNFFNLIPKKKLPSQIKIAVIGPTTAKAVEENGLEVDIQPQQSEIIGLVEAIIDYFQMEYEKLKSKFNND